MFKTNSELRAESASEMSSSSGSKPMENESSGGTIGVKPMSTVLLVTGGSLLGKLASLLVSGRSGDLKADIGSGTKWQKGKPVARRDPDC